MAHPSSRACVLMCVPVCARVRVHVLVCVRVEGSYGSADAGAREGKACGFARAVVGGACRAVQVAVRVRVRVRVRESVRARACRATTGPDSRWCQETPCGAWVCGQAEEGGLRMGWLVAFAKMAVICAL